MKKLGKMMLASLCVAMLMTVQLMAAGTTVFSGTGTQEGDTLEVSVTVTDAAVYSGEITMKYDSSVVTLTNATAGETVKDSITSINTSEKGVVVIGFADLEKVTSGEILNVEFEVVGEEPADGFVFEVSATEWSGEALNDETDSITEEEYDIVVKNGQSEIKPGDDDGKEDDGKEEGGKGDLDTGDDTVIAPYVVMVVVAAAAICGVVIYRRKKAVVNE